MDENVYEANIWSGEAKNSCWDKRERFEGRGSTSPFPHHHFLLSCADLAFHKWQLNGRKSRGSLADTLQHTPVLGHVPRGGEPVTGEGEI